MSDLQTPTLNQYARRCFSVLAVVLCATLAMVAASFAPLASPSLKIGLVLAVAAFNAVMVATFLMHIVSEKKFILIVLAFTAVFFIALMALSSVAAHDVPAIVTR